MSITQIGQQHCPCVQTMMRHNRQDNTDGEPENQPSVSGKQHPPHPGGFAGHLANTMVREMDTEGDNTLSLSETELSQEAFDAIDGDGDGTLTGKEIANGLRDNRGSLAAALGLEEHLQDHDPSERPENGPPRGKHRRQALAAYEGTMSNLMTAVFDPAATETPLTETVDVAV